MRNRKGVAFVAAWLLLAAACSGDSDETQADSDADTVAAEGDSGSVDDAGEASDDQQPEPADDSDSEGVEEEDAVALPAEGPVGAGVYSSDLMGTPITLDFDRDWVVAVGAPGSMVFADPESESPEAEVILVVRVDSFPGPAEADAEPQGQSFTGDPNDIDGWIDATGGLITEASDSVSVGDASAEVRDLKLDEAGDGGLPGGCGPGPDDRCFFVAATRSEAVPFFIVRTGEYYRMWLIDQGDEDPILVSAHARADNPGWLDDRAEAFVAGLTLGDTAPHPVALIEGNAWEAGAPSVVPAGEATFPALGGVSMTLPAEYFVKQAGDCLAVELDYEGESPFAPNVQIVRSNSFGMEIGGLTSIEDVLDLYGDEFRPQPTGETITALGEELEGYRVDGADEPELSRMIDCGANQEVIFGPQAEVFMLEADEGILIVAADAFTEDEMADARALLDQIAPTLEFSS